MISQSYPFYQCPTNALAPSTPNRITIRLRSAGMIDGSDLQPGSLFSITVTGLGGVGQAGQLIPVFSSGEGIGNVVLFCQGNERNAGQWQGVDVNQSLVLLMCNTERLEADTTYNITFDVINPQETQPSPSVRVTIAGSVTLPMVEMDTPGTALFGIAGAADPLFVTTPPGFLSIRDDICSPCFEDSWCPGGNVSNACPAFSYGTDPRIAQTNCICDVGYFGDPGGPCQLCPAGHYCPPRARNSTLCPEPRISAVGSWEPWQCEGRLDDKMISQ
eukprot:924655-Rhodomonas_salina.1